MRWVMARLKNKIVPEQQNNKLMHLKQHCDQCGGHHDGRGPTSLACKVAMLLVWCACDEQKHMFNEAGPSWVLMAVNQKKNYVWTQCVKLSVELHHLLVINIILIVKMSYNQQHQKGRKINFLLISLWWKMLRRQNNRGIRSACMMIHT